MPTLVSSLVYQYIIFQKSIQQRNSIITNQSKLEEKKLICQKNNTHKKLALEEYKKKS